MIALVVLTSGRRRYINRCRPAFYFFLIALAVVHANQVLAETRISVPGTSITMVPPVGFGLAGDFAGFVDESRGGSILVTEFPASAHSELLALFSDRESLSQSSLLKAMNVDTLERLTTDDGINVPLVHGVQRGNGRLQDKWIALFGGPATVLITMQVPLEHALNPHLIKKSFSSVIVGHPTTLAEQVDALPYRIDVIAPFEPVQLIGGLSLLMSSGDVSLGPDRQPPKIFVFYNRINEPVQDMQAAAEASFRALGFDKAKIEKAGDTKFVDSYGAVLGGTHEQGGKDRPFLVYFTVAEENRLVLLFADGDEAEFEPLREIVTKIAMSITLKNQ